MMFKTRKSLLRFLIAIYIVASAFLLIVSFIPTVLDSFEDSVRKLPNLFRQIPEGCQNIDIEDLKSQIPEATITVRDISKTNCSGRCSKIPGRRILVNYATKEWRNHQAENCESGLSVGGFDVCISFTESSIDEEFRLRNERTLTFERGSGHWLWRPYVIWKTILAMTHDDVMFYADSGTRFISNADTWHICNLAWLGSDILLWDSGHPLVMNDKATTYNIQTTKISNEKLAKENQTREGFILLKRTSSTFTFVGRWLFHNEEFDIVNEDVIMGMDVTKNWKNGVYQTVLSIFRVKRGIAFADDTIFNLDRLVKKVA